MKINSISLENFLCYYGSNNKISFSDGLNIILGPNGYGKSKLYDAFQWVFNDGIIDEKDSNRIRETNLLKKSIISDKALQESQLGDKIKCEVVIDITDNKNDRYRLKRKYVVEKKDNDEWSEPSNSTFEVYKNDATCFRPLNAELANQVKQRLIPSEVMPYVWFQGERGVNSTIDISNSKSLKKVIFHLSDVNKWDKYIEIADKLSSISKKEYDIAIRTSTKNTNEKNELLESKDYKQNQISIAKEKLNKALTNYDSAKLKHDTIISKLNSAQKINKIQSKIDMLDRELKSVINKLELYRLNLSKSLFSKYWILMKTDYIVELFEAKSMNYQRFNEERKIQNAIDNAEKNKLPRNVPERMHVQRMLDEEFCFVCNRPAKKGTAEYDAIKQKLPEILPKDKTFPSIESNIKSLYTTCFSLSDKFKNAEVEIADFLKEEDSLKERKAELDDEIYDLKSELDNEIKNSGIDKATDIINEVNDAAQDMVNYSDKIGSLNKELQNLQASLHSIELKIKSISKDDINPKLEKKKTLTDDLKELTSRIKDEQYKQLIDQLEQQANEHYMRMNEPTGAFYGKIIFTATPNGEGFIPEIVDSDDKKVYNLNTSQTTSLKLAIIMAIVTANKDRGYSEKYPLISDAPISDFDAVKAKSFLVEVAKTFNQSIIIVKDYLKKDNERSNRYMIDSERLLELKDMLCENGKTLNIIQLDLPDGISIVDRGKLQIQINCIGEIWKN